MLPNPMAHSLADHDRHHPRRGPGHAHEERARPRCSTRSAGGRSCTTRSRRRSRRGAARSSSWSATGASAVDGVPRRRRSADRVRTAVQDAAAGHGRRGARRARRRVGADAERVLIFYGDVPLARRPTTSRRSRARSTATAGALALATVRGRPTPRLRPHPARRDGARSSRSASSGTSATTRSARSARSTRASTRRASRSSARRSRRSQPNNAQGELYLTDIVAFAARRGRAHRLGALARATCSPASTIASSSRRPRTRDARRASPTKWRLAGVTVRDGARIDARRHDRARRHRSRRGVVLRGDDARWARRARRRGLRAHERDRGRGRRRSSRTPSAPTRRIGARAQIGPFSHLRPESDIGEEAHVGNFVETKKTRDRDGRQGEPPRLPRRRRSSAKARTSAPARSSATTTASRSTRRPSARAPSSAATRSSSRR